jgi:hypothetical protein
MYDVYYTTGGGPWVNAGTDMWVNQWLELISPKLDVKPILLIHRNKPQGHEEYKFPIETHWRGENIDGFDELCSGARRINILHGHYTPVRPIVENKDKIHSNVLHNSIDHIVKNQVGTDASIGWAPYLSSDWEQEVVEWATHNIWIGLYYIKYPNINIPNFYEFKHHKPLSDSTNVGFAARPEGRKNPHFLEFIPCYIFTDTYEFNGLWRNGVKLELRNHKIYHYRPQFKDKFYNMDWGISHSAFTSEPFGYGIFEAVDYGKLPILHTHWCKDLEYPYRASTKKEFRDIYDKIKEESYETKNTWFTILKDYLISNFSDKEKWIENLLDIYNK